MVPTTLKLPDELKKRVAALVQGTEKSAHAFMVDAIEQQTTLAERRKAFFTDAKMAQEDMNRTGKGYPAEEVHAYMSARSEGKKVPRPRAKRWRK
ncbi:MAG: hypothetical protein QNK18_19980 [Gammaproteobacteria bacterium]|nr:hypothetical protein [Gammaproteobacteria bacterium]